jgi:hypothetical protein
MVLWQRWFLRRFERPVIGVRSPGAPPHGISVIGQHISSQLKVCIGTDSQVKASRTEFATVIVFLRKGRGGFMYVHQETSTRKMSIKERMQNPTPLPALLAPIKWYNKNKNNGKIIFQHDSEY